MEQLLKKIDNREALIGVMGLGYVGLPLAVMFAESGFPVLGFEKSEAKLKKIAQGDSYIQDIPSARLAKLAVDSDQPKPGQIGVAASFAELGRCDAIVICVPTPLAKSKDPNLSYVVDSAELIGAHIRNGQLVVLESTTYPGTTRELILPVLAGGTAKKKQVERTVGKDFFLAYSPERVDPGNPHYDIHNTPKVIGGITENCLKVAERLYSTIVEKTVPVSSTDAAEMSKLLENTFRLINIGLVNEFSIMCGRLGVDVWEVIDAAASKPFGFIPFYPGPGLGGHCIPVDPHYLSWKLRLFNYRARFIELASEVNADMPNVVLERVNEALNSAKKSINGSRILVLGVAYKRDIDDVRESPALDILTLLKRRGADLSFHDPFVARVKVNGSVLESTDLSDEVLRRSDCVVLVTDHSRFSAQQIAAHAPLIIDTRNFITIKGAAKAAGEKLFKL